MHNSPLYIHIPVSPPCVLHGLILNRTLCSLQVCRCRGSNNLTWLTMLVQAVVDPCNESRLQEKPTMLSHFHGFLQRGWRRGTSRGMFGQQYGLNQTYRRIMTFCAMSWLYEDNTMLRSDQLRWSTYILWLQETNSCDQADQKHAKLGLAAPNPPIPRSGASQNHNRDSHGQHQVVLLYGVSAYQQMMTATNMLRSCTSCEP